MAKLKQNPLGIKISGKIGKSLVFRQMRDGSTVVCSAPDFTDRVFSEEQLTHQSRFKQAVAYAVDASKKNPIYAERAKGTLKNAYNVALSDWFNPPVIEQITRQAGCIRVYATDDVQVTEVLVTIVDEKGQIVEHGQAVLSNHAWWEYSATTGEGNLLVEARDLADNVTSQLF